MMYLAIFRMYGDFPSGQDSEVFELKEEDWDRLKGMANELRIRKIGKVD